MFWNKKQKGNLGIDFENAKTAPGGISDDLLAAFAYLTDGILVFDKDNRISLVNPQAERFLNVGREELMGKYVLDLSRFENIKPLVTALGGGMQECFRKPLEIKENLILEVSVTAMMIKSVRIGTLVILHDVSKEKLIEKMKTEFVTIAAHRLRTPASAVKWTTQMLLAGDLGELTPKQKEAVDKAFQTNERMIRLINDLLNITEIEEGKYLSKMGLFDLGEIVRLVVSDHQKTIDEKKLKVKVYMPEKELPKVMLDSEKMKIAVENIVDNSVKYTSSGGDINISLEARDKEKDVLFKIKDSGLGISAADQEKVFTKFFRGANIMTVETEGIGLGLYIAKNIIEAHGGSIWFESAPKKGSTFFFSIPIKEKFAQFVTKDFY